MKAYVLYFDTKPCCLSHLCGKKSQAGVRQIPIPTLTVLTLERESWQTRFTLNQFGTFIFPYYNIQWRTPILKCTISQVTILSLLWRKHLFKSCFPHSKHLPLKERVISAENHFNHKSTKWQSRRLRIATAGLLHFFCWLQKSYLKIWLQMIDTCFCLTPGNMEWIIYDKT